MLQTLCEQGGGMDGNTLIAFVLVLGAAAAGWIMHWRESQKRATAEAKLLAQSRPAAPAQQGGGEQNAVLYQQHLRLNELQTAKLEAEVALLQAQLKTRVDDEDRMQAAREFHELTVEKTKLEIDSLRLHIAELRKRLDEFGLGG